MATLRDLVLSPTRVIPGRLLTVRYSRSSGPGGQNVNKVATKADVRLVLADLVEVLGEGVTARLTDKLEGRLDADGTFRIVASENREQARNLEAALARMEGLMRDALKPVRPRRKTKPSKASKERRLTGKKLRGEVKRGRTRPPEA